jgi:hypothetical protein
VATVTDWKSCSLPEACGKILADTVLAIADVYPKLKDIVHEGDFRLAAKRCVGLEARRIRSMSSTTRIVSSGFTNDSAMSCSFPALLL